ncbi:MAG: M20/M25/M40 family metallo-hydrolase [Desulfobacterales bacterium]|nr:MAG: M20/M25/M40 family metallo-hydrolase [Desulfobacterales bacterium]
MESSAADQIGIYQNPVELCRNLIRFDTRNPPGNEAECISYISDLLSRAGFEISVLYKSPDRPNLITRLKGTGDAPPLMMYGHVDVVTTADQVWTHPPFEAKVADGFIWGRGALDMKSGVAMMLAAILRAKAERLAPVGDVVLVVLCDEEAGSEFGAKYLVENHPKRFSDIRYAIGEFGGYTAHVGGKKFYPIQIAEKQVCWMKATVRGPAGHGARPMRGGAMSRAADLLRRLDRHRLPVHVTPVIRQMIEIFAANLPFPKGLIFRQLLNPHLTDFILNHLGEFSEYLDPLLHNTVNATIIRGGDKVNVIPSEVTVALDGRLLPGYTPNDMLAELRQIIAKDVELEVTRHEPYPAEPDVGLFETLAGILQDADPCAVAMPLLIPAVTDARIFARLGIQSYGFIPMKLPAGFNFFQTIHGADERIPAAAVQFGTQAIYELLKRYDG